MLRDKARFSNLVYEYFFLRFKFRYYTRGDRLPSLDTLCREFNLSPQTVLSALRRLRAEGYISMHNGQNTTVLCRQSEQESLEFGIQYFSQRWDAYLDLYRSFMLIFGPMLVEGMKRMDGEDFANILRLSRRGDVDDLFHFYCFVLQKLGNSLILNLFWEVALFLGFPYAKRVPPETGLGDFSGGRRMRHIVSLAEEGDWPAVERAITTYQSDDLRRVIEILGRLIRPVPKERQIAFRWRVYRDRPQLCYDLAAEMLHEIYLGKYSRDQFLPSYETLAKENGVSVNTMRRTILMLSQNGAVETVNGKGTRIFSLGARCNAPRFDEPLVRRNLSHFLQSFELILYSCREVAGSLINALTGPEKAELIARFHAYRENSCELSLWCYLIAISQRSSLAAVREVYRRIYLLSLWGYPLKGAAEACPELEQAMIRGLEEDDAEGCAAALSEFVSDRFPAAERHLLSHGIPPEELRLPPGIRLLLTEG